MLLTYNSQLPMAKTQASVKQALSKIKQQQQTISAFKPRAPQTTTHAHVNSMPNIFSSLSHQQQQQVKLLQKDSSHSPMKAVATAPKPKATLVGMLSRMFKPTD
jgi:hypothetical protein